MPVIFGTYLEDAPLAAVASATVVALGVHYGLYTTGHLYFPYYVGVAVKNPGIPTALGIVAATLTDGRLHLAARWRRYRALAAVSR